MPAGAFAASGPTSDESSKARSRRARGTQAVRSPWQTMNLAHANDETWQQRCGAASDLAEEQNCLEKVFRDNVVGIDAVADAGRRCARRPHAAAKRGRERVVQWDPPYMRLTEATQMSETSIR